jgi:phosphoglycolate phosphatase
MNTTRIVVFDMDGTLVQARSAAWEIFQETAAKFELPVRSAEEFFELFSTNFFEALDGVCADEVMAGQVRRHFLEALRERYTPILIPGMADVVKRLAPHYALAVMSSNAMEAIRRTLETAGVAHCFAHVFSADVESSKQNHLGKVLADPLYGNLRSCSAAYVEDRPASGEEVVLVTDTVGDVHEATAAGVRVIGVSWGMHGEESLRRAGAEFVACWPQELLTRLLPGGSCRAGGCTCESGSCETTGTCTLGPATGARAFVGDVPTLQSSLLQASSRRSAQRAVAHPAAPAPSALATPTSAKKTAATSAIGSASVSGHRELEAALHRMRGSP